MGAGSFAQVGRDFRYEISTLFHQSLPPLSPLPLPAPALWVTSAPRVDEPAVRPSGGPGFKRSRSSLTWVSVREPERGL